MKPISKIIDAYPQPYMIIMHAKFLDQKPIFYDQGLSHIIKIWLKQGLQNKLKLLKENTSK